MARVWRRWVAMEANAADWILAEQLQLVHLTNKRMAVANGSGQKDSRKGEGDQLKIFVLLYLIGSFEEYGKGEVKALLGTDMNESG